MKIFGLFVLLVLAFAGVVWIKARSNETRAEAAFPPEGQFIEIDGQRVHAVVRGHGPDLVLIHGSSGNARDFTFALADRLASRYRVIAVDRPGLGYTDALSPAGASIREQAALLSAAARALGAEKPVVLGHSYGGAVALAWAVHQPDRLSGLVLLSAPTQPWNTPLDARYRRLSDPLIGPALATLMTAFVGKARVDEALDGIFAPQDPPAGYAAHVGPGLTLRRASLLANARQRANLLGEITALQPLYGEITVPVEIVHGTADTTVGLAIHAEPFIDQVPHARLTRLDRIGHMPQHTAPDAVVTAIDRIAGN